MYPLIFLDNYVNIETKLNMTIAKLTEKHKMKNSRKRFFGVFLAMSTVLIFISVKLDLSADLFVDFIIIHVIIRYELIFQLMHVI